MTKRDYTGTIYVTHRETFFNLINNDKGVEIIRVLDAYYNAKYIRHEQDTDIYENLPVDTSGSPFILKGFNQGDYERGIEYLRRRYDIYYAPPTIRNAREDILKKKDEEITSFLKAIHEQKETIAMLEAQLKKEGVEPVKEASDRTEEFTLDRPYAVGNLDYIYTIYQYLEDLHGYYVQESENIIRSAMGPSVKFDITQTMDDRISRVLKTKAHLREILDSEDYFYEP